jgi:hypothetical protein
MYPYDHIEKQLNQNAPTLRDAERIRSWEAIASQLTPHSAKVSTSFGFAFITPYPRYAIALGFIGVLVLGGGGTVIASEAARPGDVLFPIERAIENAQLRFVRNEERHKELREHFANKRLEELRTIVGKETNATKESDEKKSERVRISIAEIASFLNTAEFDDSDKVRVYTEVFGEIKDLELIIAIDDETEDKKERVLIRTHEKGESRIDIQRRNDRLRIEKKDGAVHVRNMVEEERTEIRLNDSTEQKRNRAGDNWRGQEEESFDDTSRSEDSENVQNDTVEVEKNELEDTVEREKDESEGSDIVREDVSELTVRVKRDIAEVRAELERSRDEFELPYISRESLITTLALRFNKKEHDIERVLDFREEE